MTDFFLATSNNRKREQYAEYGLDVPHHGVPDVPEPMTDILNVAAYKAQQAGPGAIVEDTALDVDGKIGVLVKYLEHGLDDYAGDPATFQVAIGVNDGENVKVYYAETKGTIVTNHFKDAYGFDGNFIPEGEVKTIYELYQENQGERVSPRKKAVDVLKDGTPSLVVPATPVTWKGEFQEEYLERTQTSTPKP